MKPLLLGLAFGLAMAPHANAEPPNAAKVLKDCASSDPAASDLCGSYLNGLMAGILIDQVSNEHKSPICIPEGETTDQVRAMIVGFVASHPEIWRENGNAVLGIAMQSVFPCQK